MPLYIRSIRPTMFVACRLFPPIHPTTHLHAYLSPQKGPEQDSGVFRPKQGRTRLSQPASHVCKARLVLLGPLRGMGTCRRATRVASLGYSIVVRVVARAAETKVKPTYDM